MKLSLKGPQYKMRGPQCLQSPHLAIVFSTVPHMISGKCPLLRPVSPLTKGVVSGHSLIGRVLAGHCWPWAPH